MTFTSPAFYFVSIKFWHFIESCLTKLKCILNLASSKSI